jgi:hypothetical protein
MTRQVHAPKKPIDTAALQAAFVAGDGIIINGVPGSGADPFGSLLVAGTGIGVAYNTTTRAWTVSNTGGGGGGAADSFDTVSKNLKSYPWVGSYTGDQLDSLTFTIPGGTIVKTLNYTGDKLTSVVLSGNTPSGIDLTKTLSYTGDNLTGVTYS